MGIRHDRCTGCTGAKKRRGVRRRIIDNLYVGTLEDCKAATGQKGWAVVHACKNPCHADQCGQKPDPAGKDYLSKQVGDSLYLNMIDGPAQFFQLELFHTFIKFARARWEEGKKLVIHCDKGESRSPTLALLFLARVLYRIPADTYDDAWDAFQVILGPDCVYAPSKGLETWMRENWNEFQGGRRLPSLDTGRESEPPVEIPQLDPQATVELIRTQPLVHFAGFTEIEDKEHRWIKPTPNVLQFGIAEVYTWCMEQGVPCRIMVLKPRQVGCSTFCAELCYHHMRRIPSDMIVMGDVAKRTEKVWEIFSNIAPHDSFAWDSRITKAHTEKVEFTYQDGSKGLVEHDTALDPKAGISGTRQIVWLTEAARYRKNNGGDQKVISAVLQSLPQAPNTLGIEESTPEGAAGQFYKNWQGAVTLEQRKAGVIGNSWIKVFAAWFEFPEHTLARTEGNAEYFDEDLDRRERRGIDLYNWSDGQIAWRRMKIATDCGGDERIFDQDFAEDAESCFLASGRPRFDMEGVTSLEKEAKIKHELAELGTLDRNDKGDVAFTETGKEESWLWVSERPKPGLRYIGPGDPCTGAQSEGSAEPDAHAFGILRAGYMDGSTWVRPKLVAVIDVPLGCRWDDDMLAERYKRLLDWYGGCEVIPETGNGLGVLNALQREEASIYQREKMDQMHPGEMLKVAGWETNKKTRPLVINAVAAAIREKEIDCTYAPAVSEMRTFIINDRGKAEAKDGCHDDWVMMLGIGLFNIERASVYQPPRIFSSYNEPRKLAAISLS